MNFSQHIIPLNFKESDKYREERALAAFISCARDLKSYYSISGRFKLYRSNMESCTVVIMNKSFTYRGDDCVYDSCKAAIYYLLDTFPQFSDLKLEKDRILAQRNRLCKEIKFDILIPA